MCRAAVISLTAVSLLSLLQIVTVAQGLRGEAVEHTVTVDGMSRKYLVFAPKGFDKPLPVVLALHGGGGNARQLERYTRFNDPAAKAGFLVIYPEAMDGNWDNGRDIQGVRAQQETCHPDHPVSILIIQGDADPLVPIRGGMVGFPRGRKRGQVVPTEETISLYVRRNGNQGEPTVTTLDRDKKDGTSVEIKKYPDGPGGVKTQVYIVRNGGRTWAGRPLYLPEMLIGKASQEFSATDVIWEFFKSCPPRRARSGSNEAN